MGPFNAWPTGGGGFEHFYGFIGGETNQYAPAIYQDTVPIEPDRTADEGYHFTEDMTDRTIDWISQQKALMPDKPFFVYYAPGATHAPHHVRPEWSDKYKGRFDDGWDALREADAREAEGDRSRAAGGGADRTAGRDPRLGRHARRPQAGARAADGGLRRLPRAHGPPHRPAARRARRARDPREHARLLHHRRQRRLRRGLADRLLQRARRPERRVRARDDGVHGLEDRRLRHPRGLQPLRRRLGARDGHAVPVDEAGRLALGRDAERHDRALAEWDQGEGRDPLAVPPRDRRRRDGARGGRPAGAAQRQRGAAAAARGRLDGLHVRRCRGCRPSHDAVLRDVLQPGHLPRGLDRGDTAQHPLGGNRDAGVRRRRLGALRPRRLDAGVRPGRRQPGEAPRAPAPVHHRGREVQRPAARRSSLRALQRRHGGAAAARAAATRSSCSARWGG